VQITPVCRAQVDIGRDGETFHPPFPATPESDEAPLGQKIVYHSPPNARIEIVVFPDEINGGLGMPSSVMSNFARFRVVPKAAKTRRANISVSGVKNPIMDQ